MALGNGPYLVSSSGDDSMPSLQSISPCLGLPGLSQRKVPPLGIESDAPLGADDPSVVYSITAPCLMRQGTCWKPRGMDGVSRAVVHVVCRAAVALMALINEKDQWQEMESQASSRRVPVSRT